MDILLFNKSHFLPELQALGHRVLVAAHPAEFSDSRPDKWSLTQLDLPFENHEPIESILNRLPPGFSPEALVYHDDSNPFLRVEGFERSTIPMLFYQVDAHIHFNWFPQMLGVAGAVWVAQRDYAQYYQKFHSQVSWVPLWASEFGSLDADRPVDACFRGNLDPHQRAQRITFLERVSQFVQLDSASGPFQEIYQRSKIVLNESIGDDLNFRVFEAMASGALLLTPRVGNGLLDLLQDGVHLVTYERNNPEDAALQIKRYLSDDEQRRVIAERGCAEVRKNHSTNSRAHTLIRALANMPKASRGLAYLGAAYRILLLASIERSMLAPESAHKVLRLLNEALTDAELQFATQLTAWENILPFMYFEILEVLKTNSSALASALESLEMMYVRLPTSATLGLLALHVALLQGRRDRAQKLADSMGIELEPALGLAPQVIERLSAASPFRIKQ